MGHRGAGVADQQREFAHTYSVRDSSQSATAARVGARSVRRCDHGQRYGCDLTGAWIEGETKEQVVNSGTLGVHPVIHMRQQNALASHVAFVSQCQ